MRHVRHANDIGSTHVDRWPVLASLVGDTDSFAAQCWGLRPVVAHSLEPFEELLSGSAISDLLELSTRRPHFRMVRDGTAVAVNQYTKSVRLGGTLTGDVADVEGIGREFAAGATLVLQSLERIHPPLREFARALEAEISHPVQTNAYLSPPSASGLARHSDDHDVFVVQIEGSKSWDVEGLGPVELAEGDVLYIPRGCAHSASTNERYSLHLTVGVLSVTFGAVVRRAIGSLEDGFDRALPLGFADDSERLVLSAAIGDAIARASTQLLSRDVVEVARSEQHRVRRNLERMVGLRRELALLGLSDASVIRVQQRTTLKSGNGWVEIGCGGRVLRMPNSAAPALEALVSLGTVTIGDLVGLNTASRLVLARRLLREEIVGLHHVAVPATTRSFT